MWWNGFLGTDATFMLDFVVCALGLVAGLQLFSIWLVKVKKLYKRHQQMQIFIGLLLLVTVIAFEIDMRLHGGWENIINKDPAHPAHVGESLIRIRFVLYIHLIFAISTPLLWIVTLLASPWKTVRPVASLKGLVQHHKILGWITTIDLGLTSITGIWFYYLAFIAKG
jgi:hypothetical protein